MILHTTTLLIVIDHLALYNFYNVFGLEMFLQIRFPLCNIMIISCSDYGHHKSKRHYNLDT